jgi:uncharacterized membrane protein YczE
MQKRNGCVCLLLPNRKRTEPGFLARFLSMLLGLWLYALGIVVTINADVGYAPWDAFHAGLADKTGMTLGMASIIGGGVIIILVTLSGEKLGIATILNMFLIGLFIDLIMLLDIIPVSDSFAVGIVMLVAGMFIIAFGSYFYIKAAFGAGPRDNLMVVLARRTNMPVGLCRGLVELLAAVAGWLLGGMVGVGTVISFIAIGGCVQIVFSALKFDVAAVEHENLGETFSRLNRQR